ncbi:MAG: hypothetical protein JWM58_109 [Rhizobium sp.]|nr:hypothetical protein [Rhizobium sp.]
MNSDRLCKEERRQQRRVQIHPLARWRRHAGQAREQPPSHRGWTSSKTVPDAVASAGSFIPAYCDRAMPLGFHYQEMA